MSLAAHFIGVSPITAQSIQGDAATYAAAGSTQTTATDITTSTAKVSSGTGGVQLPTGVIGDEVTIWNTSGSSITVYPPSGASINQLSANTGAILANNTVCIYKVFSGTQYVAVQSA